MFDSLRSLSDNQSLASTDSIIDQDRKLTLRVLVHLHEIECRKLHLKRGYSSMFAYCTSHLKLSEPAALRRLKSARCLVRFPELCALLETGDVNLTTVSMIAKILKPENKGALLARIRGKSRREVEAIVAEHEPRAVLPPDCVRTIVVPVPRDAQTDQKCTVAGDGKKSSNVEQSTLEDRRTGDHEELPGVTVMGTAKLERHAVVEFSAREIVINKLERVRSIASHRLPANAPLEQVIEFLADYFTEREDPAKRHARREVRKMKEKNEPVREPVRPVHRTKTARSIPSPVRDQVFTRDKGRCTYVSRDGKQCGSTHVLQVDHVQPVARGGASTLDNLRLLCAHHNRLEAERLMGRGGPPAPPRG